MNESLRGCFENIEELKRDEKYGGESPRLCTNETEGSPIDARKHSEIVKRRFPLNLSGSGVLEEGGRQNTM